MLLTILVFLLILSFLVLAHELGHFVVAKISGVRVEEFGLGMFFKVWSIKRGETEYSLNALPIGGFVRLSGEEQEVGDDPRSFGNKSKASRFSILSAGVLMNYILAIVLFSFCYITGMPQWGTQVKIAGVVPGSPAEAAGIKESDYILGVQDKRVATNQDLTAVTQEHLGEEITVQIQRENAVEEVKLTPRKDPPANEGPMGISVETSVVVAEYLHYSFGRSVIESFKMVGDMTKAMVAFVISLPRDLIVSKSVPEGVAGPVGIGQVVGELVKFGIRPLLQFAGILSLNLAIINILPFPALDGGRILFVGIEAVIRRKVPFAIERWIHTAGMAMLLLLIAFITYRDIVRLF